jgi:nucleotide-binding universal stress UspA family protein
MTSPGPAGAPPARTFREICSLHFDEAEALGFPVFLTSSAKSSPINGTPYLAPWARFREAAARWPGRAGLIEALERVRGEAEALGAAVDFILIGGSFTETARPAPGDVDCVLFHRRRDPAARIDPAALAAIERRGKAEGADARFVALDGDPAMLIKSVSYYSILYSNDKHEEHRHGVRVVRALFLLDCREGRAGPAAAPGG